MLNQTMQTTLVVRERGQLMIPDKIRKALVWLRPDAVVKLFLRGDEVILKEYQSSTADSINWKKIWEKIQLARSFKGKKGNLTQCIIEDREKH